MARRKTLKQRTDEAELTMQLEILDSNYDKNTNSIKSDIKNNLYTYDALALLAAKGTLQEDYIFDISVHHEMVRDWCLRTEKPLKNPIKEWVLYVAVQHKEIRDVSHATSKTFQRKKDVLEHVSKDYFI